MKLKTYRRCEQCDGKGYMWLDVSCVICNGNGQLSPVRCDKLQKQAVEKAAKDGYVYLLGSGMPGSGWSNLRTFGPYVSPCQKVLQRKGNFALIETWWNGGEWFDLRTGWKRGVRVPPERQRTTWHIAPLSLEFARSKSND